MISVNREAVGDCWIQATIECCTGHLLCEVLAQDKGVTKNWHDVVASRSMKVSGSIFCFNLLGHTMKS